MRRPWAPAMLALLLLLPTASAYSHSFEPALLDVRERESGVFDVVWRAPGKESGTILPGDPPLVPVLPASCREIARLDAGSDELEERTVVRIDCGVGRLRGERIAVPGIAGSRVDVIVRITWNDGSTTSGVLRSANEELIVPRESVGGLGAGAPARLVASRYLGLGVDHILGGYDHLLFVAGLFLLVSSTRALVTTISAFTIAHSLTLALAVLRLITVPSAPVEILIALSILLLARELTLPTHEPPTITRRFPWAVAFIFGLLHGLGFAGALTETGVPSDQIPLALLAFNLGVEAGQLAVVVALALSAMAVRRVVEPSSLWARVAPAYAMGAIAFAWTVERFSRLLRLV